jgi:hypothetical protein
MVGHVVKIPRACTELRRIIASMTARYTTVPIRCPVCGQQTHKTLASVVQDGAFFCKCGARNELDIEQFAKEIEKSDADIEDFGRKR